MAITEITNLAMTRPRVLRKLLDAETDTIEANMHLAADNRQIQFGAVATDAYITFDGTDLIFYDTTVGATKTLTQLAAAGSPTLDATFDGGKTIDGATSSANAMQVGGTNDKILFYENANNDVRIGTTAGANLSITAEGGAIDFGNENLTTTGTINIGADSVNLTLGASGATDAYIQFNGTNLIFYDSNHGATVTLSDMAGSNLNGPTVIGDMTFSDGKVIWTDLADENVLAITADAVTTNSVITVSGDGVTTGNLLRLAATEATLNGGAYINCYDETAAASVFVVKEDGAVTITGVAGDVLTLTLGSLQMTDGNIDMDEGKIEVDTTTDETSYIKKNVAGTAACLEVENTHTASTGSGILIDQNGTGNSIALEITHDGDLAAIDISAGVARTGNVITIPMANQLAQTALDITGAATGTSGEGIIHVDVTGVLAGNAIRVDSTGANATTGQLLYLLSAGNQAGATNGICGYFQDTGAAAATSYTVYIASTNNEALHIDAGLSLFDERVTITLADNTGPALAITNPDTTGNTNAVTVTPSGSGAGILISPQEADTQGLLITTIASSTVPLIDIDGTTGAGWIGAANVGMLDLTGDGALADAAATLVRLAYSGNAAAVSVLGSCLRLEETGAASGTSYALYISSTNNEALRVDAGKVLVDETVTATGGLITKVAVTDVATPPTQANMVTAFGAAATAGAGFIGYLDDAGAGVNQYICVSNGTNWYYSAALTLGA